MKLLSTFTSVAPIQQFGYVPIYLCFIIQIAYMYMKYMHIYAHIHVHVFVITTVHTWYGVNYFIVHVLYF